MSEVTEEKEPTVRRLETSLSFLEELERELSFIRGGPGLSYFLSYANDTDLGHLLTSKEVYTILAPIDEAFQSWHPIDWGFNPFLVKSFLNSTLANHVIEGEILQPDTGLFYFSDNH